ncbi:phage baseplate assembly protein V, partial [Bacteroides heparinolyticus]
FIPEVGDHVLVGFRYNDPNRPYVMGSLFNGVTGGGGGKDNKCKSLTIRSGSSLKLDDSDGSVTLHDKGGVKMNFYGGGNQSLTAVSTATTSVGKEGASVLKMDSIGNIDLSGKNKITLKVGGNTIVIDGETSSITVESDNIIVKGKTFTEINGGKGKITAMDNVSISGSTDVIIN